MYEHLYFSALDSFCREEGIFYFLDYRWSGIVYAEGLLRIEIVLLTPTATRKLTSRASKLKIDFSEEAIFSALTEIMAEDKRGVGGKTKLFEASLRSIHDTPWQTIEEFAIFDAHTLKRTRKVLWESDKKVAIKKMECSLSLLADFAAENRKLLPLY